MRCICCAALRLTWISTASVVDTLWSCSARCISSCHAQLQQSFGFNYSCKLAATKSALTLCWAQKKTNGKILIKDDGVEGGRFPLQDLIAACPSAVICQKCRRISEASLLINYAKVRQLNCREICVKTSLDNARCGTKMLQARSWWCWSVAAARTHTHLLTTRDGWIWALGRKGLGLGLELVLACFRLAYS